MNRRDFLATLAAGTAACALRGTLAPSRAHAQARAQSAPRSLTIASRTLDIAGRSATVFGLTAEDGTPGLTVSAGERFDVRLASRIDAPTLIHWHGLTPPWDQDGVPDNPAAPLAPGDSRAYDFPAGPGGTHWMHAHTLQEQALLAAPLIVRTKEDAARDEQEVVILLHDFSFTPAETLLARLRGPSSGMGHGAMDHGAMNLGGMSHGSMGHGGMTHVAGSMDLNDIAYDAYLTNDRTLHDPQVVRVESGGRVRLRIINGAAATGFILSTGQIDGTVIAVDGQPVRPVTGRAFPLSMGQRIDIRLALPNGSGAHPVLALREGERERTGIILATRDATVRRLDSLGASRAGVLGLDLERSLSPLAPLQVRTPDRRHEVHLTGTMAGYEWGMGGPGTLPVKSGERVEITMVNMSMMAHPMHLHGHRFQVLEVNGRTLAGAVRDTVLVPPMARIRIAFDADNPGRWPFHCHHLYHMASGMMAFIAYDDAG